MYLAKSLVFMASIVIASACSPLTNKKDSLELSCGLDSNTPKPILRIEHYEQLGKTQVLKINSRAESKQLEVTSKGCLSLAPFQADEVIAIRSDGPQGRVGSIMSFEQLDQLETVKDIELKPAPDYASRLNFCQPKQTLYSNVDRLDLANFDRAFRDSGLLLYKVLIDNQMTSPNRMFYLSAENPSQQSIYVEGLNDGTYPLRVDIYDPLSLTYDLPSKNLNCVLVIDRKAPKIELLGDKGSNILKDPNPILSPGEKLLVQSDEAITLNYCFVSTTESSQKLCGEGKEGFYLLAPSKGKWRLTGISADLAGNQTPFDIAFAIYDQTSVALVKNLAESAQESFTLSHANLALEAESRRLALATSEEANPLQNITKSALMNALIRTQEIGQFSVPKDHNKIHWHANGSRLMTWNQDEGRTKSDEVRIYGVDGKNLGGLESTGQSLIFSIVDEQASLGVFVSQNWLVRTINLKTFEQKQVKLQQLTSAVLSESFNYQPSEKSLYILASEEKNVLLVLNIDSLTIDHKSLPFNDAVRFDVLNLNGETNFLFTGEKNLKRCSADLVNCSDYSSPCVLPDTEGVIIPGDLKFHSLVDSSIVISCNGQSFIVEPSDFTIKKTCRGTFQYENQALEGFISLEPGVAIFCSSQSPIEDLGKSIINEEILQALYDPVYGGHIFLGRNRVTRFLNDAFDLNTESWNTDSIRVKSAAIDSEQGILYLLSQGLVSKVRLSPLNPYPRLRPIFFPRSFSALGYAAGAKTLVYSNPMMTEPKKLDLSGQIIIETRAVKNESGQALLAGVVSKSSQSNMRNLDVISETGELVYRTTGEIGSLQVNDAGTIASHSSTSRLELFSATRACKPITINLESKDAFLGLSPLEPKALVYLQGQLQILDCRNPEQPMKLEIADFVPGQSTAQIAKSSDRFALAKDGKILIYNWSGTRLFTVDMELGNSLILVNVGKCPIIEVRAHSSGEIRISGSRILVDLETGRRSSLLKRSLYSRLLCHESSKFVVESKGKGFTLYNDKFEVIGSEPLQDIFAAKFGFFSLSYDKPSLTIYSPFMSPLRSQQLNNKLFNQPRDNFLSFIRDSDREYMTLSEEDEIGGQTFLFDEFLNRLAIPEPPSYGSPLGSFLPEGCLIWSVSTQEPINEGCHNRELPALDPNNFLFLNGRDGPLWLPLANELLMRKLKDRLSLGQ